MITLNEHELCIIQQALNLRKLIQINNTDFRKGKFNDDLLKETTVIHNKIVKMIQVKRAEDIKGERLKPLDHYDRE